MKDIRQHIKNVLVEENQNKKVNLVKQMIYDLFDEVSFIEQSTYDNKPLLTIYFDSDDPAANIESWFDEHISRTILEYTGGNIIVLPYWTFSWDYRKKNVDIYIDTEKLKYDNLGNVINESNENKKLENPIEFFYTNFLNREPIEYKGIILQPTYNRFEDVITWKIKNPENHSFNGELIKELAIDEFRDFCSLVNLNFGSLYNQVNIISNMPEGRYYLNKKDRNYIETILKNKKILEFSIHEYDFYLNFEYIKNTINIYQDTIEIITYGKVSGFKIDVKTKEKTKIEQTFLDDLSDAQYDDYRGWQYEDFYSEVMSYLRQNPRFYDNRIDMFDLHLEFKYKPSI